MYVYSNVLCSSLACKQGYKLKNHTCILMYSAPLWPVNKDTNSTTTKEFIRDCSYCETALFFIILSYCIKKKEKGGGRLGDCTERKAINIEEVGGRVSDVPNIIYYSMNMLWMLRTRHS
jgi:hypothetical protein